MKILVNEIPEQESEIKLKAPIEDFNFCGEEVTLKDPVTVKMKVDRVGKKIIIQGVIQTLLQLECSRCLEDFFCHVDEPFTVTFFPAEDRPKEPDLELESEDLDVSFYEEQEIDLSELVREQILLAVPMNPVCKLNCRGLCSECGQNLNEGRCSCSGSKVDTRWSKLKDFKQE